MACARLGDRDAQQGEHNKPWEVFPMPSIVAMVVAAILAIAVPVATFVLVSGWMISEGVPSVIASVIGAAAVFGEIGVAVTVAIHR